MRKVSGEHMALSALSAEARRRGVSYGQLVANTTAVEQERIVVRFEARFRKKSKQDAR